MRKLANPLIIGMMVLAMLVAGCATMTPIQSAKTGAKISKDTIILVQKAAALARDSYLDSVANSQEPAVPYLDDSAWELYLDLEERLVAVHEVYVEAVKLAEDVGEIDLDRASFYLELASDHQAQLTEILQDIGKLLEALNVPTLIKEVLE